MACWAKAGDATALPSQQRGASSLLVSFHSPHIGYKLTKIIIVKVDPKKTPQYFEA